MSANGKQKKQKEVDSFYWSDDEIQLLLEVTAQFKATNEYKGINWDSLRSKYEQIRELFEEGYQTENDDDERFPRSNTVAEHMTKERIAAKLKRIRTSYKLAVDSGKQSGGGRIVYTFFHLCEKIWGGSLAVNSIPGGIDTSSNSLDSNEFNYQSGNETEEREMGDHNHDESSDGA